jgi:hypothetical protein
MLRIVTCTLILFGFMAMLIHFGIEASLGSGVGMLCLAATTSALLAFAAVAWRTRVWVRSIFLIAGLAVTALLVDELSYSVWHARLEGFVAGLQRDVESGSPDLAEKMRLSPTSVQIEPGQVFLFTFEPPALAWTYRLETATRPGRVLVTGWHRALARMTRGVGVDPVAEAIIEPHEAYAVTIASGDGAMACRAAGDHTWVLSVGSQPAARPL